MAKANPVTGTTYYVPKGGPVPTELGPDVRLVGPGAPAKKAKQPEPAGSPNASENPAPESEPTDEYDEWTNDDLREELQERSLATSGNKADLIKRLRADDQEERP